MSGKRDVIRRIRPLAQLGDADCDAMLSLIKARRGAAGDVLFAEGDATTSLLVIAEGHLAVRVRGSDGAPVDVASLGPGEVVGEMAAFDPSPRSATVVARAPTLVVELTREALGHLRKDAPFAAAALHRGVVADLARRLREVNARIERQLDGASARSPRLSMANPPPSRARGGSSLTAQQLRAQPALRDYADADLELLSRATALRAFGPKEVLFEEGTVGDSCFLLLQGEVDVVRKAHDKVRILASLRAGALVGQLALIDRAPRSASVVACAPTYALELGQDMFDRLMQACSPMALRFQEQVAIAGIRQLRSATARVVALIEQRNDADAYLHGARPSGDDWDAPIDAGEAVLELAIDPKSLRR
ncbi:MAG: cyclic nucleotide-binding domain-containing protein [Deltaproteobacteria bacterium]|nr:cyclic nucleotide-binding domain-containing protein [Deltaproteobacteria bacterium]